MALDTFIAGRYSNTYDSVDTGITEQGYEITKETFHEVIGESDAYGQSPIEGIWRGGQCMVDFLSLASKSGSHAAFWPYGGNLSAGVFGVMGTLYNPGISGTKLPIGSLATDLARAFVLTVTAGTPAATGVLAPASLTANKALLREGFPGKLLFSSKLRRIPLSMRFWPYDAGAGVIKFFVPA